MIKRLLGAAFALTFTALPAAAQSTNPLVNFQSFLNQKIVPNGRGLITGTDLNNVMNRLVPVFNSVCSTFDSNGNCTLIAPNLVSKLGDTIVGLTQVSSAGCTSISGARTTTDGTQSYVSTCSGMFVGLDPASVPNVAVTGTAYTQAWATSKSYPAGAAVVANGNLYRTTAGGTSAASGAGPSGTGSSIADGSVTWAYVSASLVGAYDPTQNTTSQVFINVKTKPGIVGQNGLTVNFDSGEGAPGNVYPASNVGVIITAKQHPRSNGSAAPQTWLTNTNFVAGSGSGGSLFISNETDITNNDKICAHVSDGCQPHIGWWHNYQTAFPIGQDTFITANSAWQSAVVTVSGTSVVPTSGAPFSPDTTTVYLGMSSPVTGTSTGVAPLGGGNRYRVNPGSYNPGTGAVTLLTTPTQQGTGINSAWNPHAVADVFFLTGDTVASDSDFHDNTSAYNALKFEGAHQVLIDGSNDVATIFAAVRGGSYLCMDGMSYCWTHTGGALAYGTPSGGAFSIADNGRFTTNGGGAITAATVSTSPATGALTDAGGLGVGGDIFSGASINALGAGNFGGALKEASTVLMATTLSFNNGAGTASPTLGATGPTGATTPTKWIPVNDNGTTRYVPAW